MPKLSPLFVLSLSAPLLMVGVGMIVALLPQRVLALTGSLESVGLVASVFALAYLLAQLPVGILSDRLGAKRFLVIGYVLCALSGVVFFASGTAGGIYLGRAVQGLGEAPIWALGPAVLALAYPTGRGRAIGIYNGAIHIGLTFGPLVGLWVAPGGVGRLPFLIFAGLCIAGGAFVLAFLRAGPVQSRRPGASAEEILAVLRQPTPAVLLLGVLLYGTGYGVFVSVLPASLTGIHGFGARATSALFVLFYAAISVSQIVSGPLSDRIGRGGFLIWGMALAAVGMATLPIVPGLWVYAPLGLASTGLGMFCVASIAALNERVPDRLKGAISGGYYFFWGAGYVLGPLATGFAETRVTWAGYLSLAALFGLLALVVRLVRA